MFLKDIYLDKVEDREYLRYHQMILLENSLYTSLNVFVPISRHNNMLVISRYDRSNVFKINLGNLMIETDNKRLIMNILFPHIQTTQVKPFKLKTAPTPDLRRILDYVVFNHRQIKNSIKKTDYDKTYNQICNSAILQSKFIG